LLKALSDEVFSIYIKENKGKFFPARPVVELYLWSLSFVTSTLDGVEGQHHTTAALCLEKDRRVGLDVSKKRKNIFKNPITWYFE
jgi:hypothetical protein